LKCMNDFARKQDIVTICASLTSLCPLPTSWKANRLARGGNLPRHEKTLLPEAARN